LQTLSLSFIISVNHYTAKGKESNGEKGRKVMEKGKESNGKREGK
jgi:hypothetical protein